MKNFVGNRTIKYFIGVCLCVLAVFSIIQGCRNAMRYPTGSFDFQYDSAKYIALGIDPYEESMNPTGMQEKLNLGYYYGELEANQFPSMLILLIPFTFFSPMTANLMFLLFNLACTIGILVLLKKMFVPDTVAWMDLICLFSFFLIGTPWRNNIGNGQHTIFSFFFFLLCIFWGRNKHRIAAGISLAIAFFKYTLTVPMALYLVYKKKYKELIIAVSIHGILTLISSFWLKTSLVDLIIKPLKVSSNLSGSGSYDINSILHLGNYGMVIAVILMLIVFIYAVMGRFPGTDEELLALLTMLSLVIVYHRAYDYFVLIIPLIVFSLRKQDNIIGKIGKSMLYICVAYVFIGNKILNAIVPLMMGYIEYLYAFFFYSTMIILLIGVYKNQNKSMINSSK